MWVVVALASLAVLIIIVLCIPLDVALRVDVYGKPRFGMRLTWLFGLVAKEVSRGKKKLEEKKRPAKVKGKPGKRRIGAGVIFGILRTRGLLRQLRGLLMGILRLPKIKDFTANLRVGLDDPADTGFLFALLGPAIPFLSPSFPYQIKVQPSLETGFEGYLQGTVRLRPIQMLPPLIKFTFSLATIRVIKRLVLTKWKRGKK